MIHYVTGNNDKFLIAKKYFDQVNLPLHQLKLVIKEYQFETSEEVAIEKAKAAFEQVSEPLFVNDSGWLVPALNGFPGPYMKYMNDWFLPEDFIALLSRHEDKRVILRQTLVYKDREQLQVFTFDIEGHFLDMPRGMSGVACDKVISLGKDGKSIAEHKDEGYRNDESEREMWAAFIGWLKEKK